MQSAVELARRAAPVRSTVLVTGETGTGKELLAELIHGESTASGAPFVRVNCAALPAALLESELFGHERGAFTGAERQRIGRFEEAGQGTLFLDEIAEIDPPTQAKLLRALQEREFRRVGGLEALAFHGRVVAATNRDLPAAIARGDFREDLYFRLNVIHVHLPPLRSRAGDVVPLAERFLVELGAELERPGRFLTPSAREALETHDWPGNVRELRNAVERALLLSDGPAIEGATLGLAAREGRGSAAGPPGSSLRLRDAEERLVLEALERSGFVQKRAARLLGISPRKLNYLVSKYGFTHPSWRRHVPGPGVLAPPGEPDSSESRSSRSGEEGRRDGPGRPDC